MDGNNIIPNVDLFGGGGEWFQGYGRIMTALEIIFGFNLVSKWGQSLCLKIKTDL